MASIQSLGIGSGLLTSDLVDDIISAEREATDLRLEAQRAEVDARISSFAGIRSVVDQLRTATADLSTPSGLVAITTTSSNDTVVTASASSDAALGVHTLEVQSLARKATLASARYESLDSVVGDGTLDIRFGTTVLDGDGNYDSFTENEDRAAVSIEIDETNNTLSGVRDAINQAEVGVVASIVNDGEGYVLVLTSDRSGADHSLEVTATEGTTAGLASLSYNATDNTPGTHLTQAVAGQDAVLTVDGITISREENTVTEVIPGLTFNALSVGEGPVTITVGQDDSAVVERVQGFVTAFNDVKSVLDSLTDFDEEAGTGALLLGDSTIRGLRTQMRRLLSASISELGGDNLRALVDIGVRTNQNADFALTLDTTTLSEALASNPQGVQNLLSTSSRASDEQIQVMGFQNATEAGSYEVVLRQVATRGAYTGSAVGALAGSTIIDDDNDELSFAIDGISASIQLTQQTYASGAELAQEIQTQLNNTASLQTAGTTVDVTFDDATNQLSVTSASQGSLSRVAVTAVDTQTLATLGIDVDDGESGRGVDVAGTINGIEGTGSGQFLTLPLGPVAASSGVYRGASTTAFDGGPLTVDASNGEFSVSVDGTPSGTITLTPGSYANGAELATEIQSQINADANLIEFSRSVTVTFNPATQGFEMTSASSGSSSRVDVVSVAAGVPTDLGLSVAAGVPGKRASQEPDPASGIQIQVLGGEVGERGTVSVVRGVMSRFDRFLDDTLAFDGTLQSKVNSLEEQLSDINEEAAEFAARMTLLEDRLKTQFAAADALISQLNSTSSFLDSQLASLPGYTNGE